MALESAATVREAMTSPTLTVHDDESAIKALRTLVREEHGGAPVVDDEGLLVGVITDYDLLLAIDIVGAALPVSRVMSTDVRSVTSETLLDDARDLMLTTRCRLIPVVDERLVVGVLSRRDVLRTCLGMERTPR